MSFQQGLSGLAAANKDLDVIGNNVANAGTYGYKAAKTNFSDLYASSLQGGSAINVGLGVKVNSVTQTFNQGNITATNSPLDMAINGGGFFRLSTNGAISYTRNGQFSLDKDGFIISSSGDRLTGYSANSQGVIAAGSPTDLQINLTDITPQTTTAAKAQLNLDSRLTPPGVAFNPADPTSFNFSTSLTVYDSLGNAKTLTSYYVKQPVVNTWNVEASLDGTPLAGPVGVLAFNTDGSLNAGASTNPAVINAPATGGAAAFTFNIDFAGSTQFGSANSVNLLTQDGFASGRLNGYSIGVDGTILGRYSNGESKNLGQVALANFVSPTALLPIGDNKWTETPGSGQPLVGVPGTSSLGSIQASALEESNVDLTQALVAMITTQRIYQANAQTIKTQDGLLQTLVNLR